MDRFRAPQADEEPREICDCDACGLAINADDDAVVINEGEYIIHDSDECKEGIGVDIDNDDLNKMKGEELEEGGYL